MRTIDHLSLKFKDKELWCLDQTLLPGEEKWIQIKTPDEMILAIQKLQVRGAPLIGVAAALALGLYCVDQSPTVEEFKNTALKIREARPTAVNLMVAMDRMMNKATASAEELFDEALSIFDEDAELCRRMAEYGSDVIQDGDHILTHCNTGALATAGGGTALGVIHQAHKSGKKIHVFVDETRPLLQGARLTTWELEKYKIPYTLICDNMAGFLMAQGKVNKVFVGADRIAANGDFANKIGTYSLAVLCHHHRVPFYMVAPRTTVDSDCESGKEIPIEERNPDEVLRDWSPRAAAVWNPAFDVTPHEFVSGWILEDGIFSQSQVREGIFRRQS